MWSKEGRKEGREGGREGGKETTGGERGGLETRRKSNCNYIFIFLWKEGRDKCALGSLILDSGKSCFVLQFGNTLSHTVFLQ